MVPPAMLPLFRAFREAGGRALVIGGSVRDTLLGHPGKDVDIEVHGLALDDVVGVMRRFGSVNEVGRAFGVLKLRLQGRELDVSLPRRDEREGPGHRGIRATADPWLGVEHAARRRDLTINAIAYDPLTGEYVDPFGGREDLRLGVLRAVDVHTFGEDPLRALRVAQFAARFGFAVDPALEALCVTMPLHELPAERIRTEVEKLLLKGRPPSVGWAFAHRTGAWAQVIPEWEAVPAGLDAAAAAPVGPPPRRLALLYAAACADLSPADAERVLDRLRVHRVSGYPVRATVLSLLARQDEARREPSPERVRRLAEAGELELLAALVQSPGLHAAGQEMGVLTHPLPPLLAGRDLTALGVPPGPAMGSLLEQVREGQLAGRLTTPDEARAEVLRLLEPDPTP